MKEIKLLESLTGKTVTLKEASLTPIRLELGDIIKTRHGNLVIIDNPKLGRVWTTIPIVEEREVENYLDGTKTIKVEVLKVKSDFYLDKVGTIPLEKAKELRDIYQGKATEINRHNSEVKSKQFEKNSPSIVWDDSKSQYSLIMKDGNKAFAGDQVRVQFSNGIFSGRLLAIAGRDDGKVSILFGGKQKGRSISPSMVLAKV